MPKALKGRPKSIKLPNLVTLLSGSPSKMFYSSGPWEEEFPPPERFPVDDVTEEEDPMKLLSSTEQFPGLLKEESFLFILQLYLLFTALEISANIVLQCFTIMFKALSFYPLGIDR